MIHCYRIMQSDLDMTRALFWDNASWTLCLPDERRLHFRAVPALCRPGFGFQLFCRPPLPSHTPLSFVVMPDYSSHFWFLPSGTRFKGFISGEYLSGSEQDRCPGPVLSLDQRLFTCEDEPGLRCNSCLSLWKITLPKSDFTALCQEKLWFRERGT